MANKMLIDSSHPEETRVVVVRGQKVEEFDFESASRRPLRGNIYLAKVTRVEPSLQAAFIEYGGNRHGFLAFNEIHPDYYQIPVADRQALLEEDAREEREFEREEERRRTRHRSAARSRRRDEATASEETEERGENGENGSSFGDGEKAGEDAAEHGFENGPENGERAEADDHAPECDPEEAQADAGQDDRAEDDDEAPPAPASEVEVVEISDSVETVGASAEPEGGGEGNTEFAFSSEAEAEDPGDAGGAEENGDEDEGQIEQVGGRGDALEELPERPRRPRRQYKIQEVIKRRQILLVQVVKEERGNKGAALTTYLSLAGRYSVLMPNTGRGGGISRKITNSEDRKRLKEVARELEVPDGMGIILRTAGASRTKAEIKRDYEYLMRMWESVRELTMSSSAPALVYEEGSLTKRAIRDLYNKDIDEILVSGEEGYREAKDFMRMLMPSHAKCVQPYRDPQPLFARYGVEQQLDAMFSNHVTLRSGGYLVINPTEALVSIDVNSGRSTREHNIEDTALRTNLEAAEEIARQLRLRDLAGLIVIDFIDMEEKRNNRAVEKKLNDCLRNDRARIQVGRISPFGLLEMSRQRIRTGVLESSSVLCPHCAGTGFVRATPSVALQILRSVEEALIKSASHNLTIRARTAVAFYILNQKRAHLSDLEARFGVTLSVSADESLAGATVFAIDRGDPATRTDARPLPVHRGVQIDEVEIEDDEIAAESEETEAEDETASAEGNGEDRGEGRRRRRRRRRRGGRGEGRDDEISARESDENGDEDEESEPGSEDDENGGAEEAGGSETDEEGRGELEAAQEGEGGRRRTRRRGGRGRGRRGREDRPFGEENGEADAEPRAPEGIVAEPAEAGEARAEAPADETPEPIPAAVESPEEPREKAAAETSAAPEPAEEPAPAAPASPAEPEPEPVAIVLTPPSDDPDRPKRAGWWSRAKAALGGS